MDLREKTTEDDFDLRFQRLGWQSFSCQPCYSDPQVIRQRWSIAPSTGANITLRAFYQRFGDNRFRKLLRAVFQTRTPQELERICSSPRLDDHLKFMQEQEIAVLEEGYWRKSPQYQDIADIGRTLEWYVAEWFRSELKSPARHGVHVEGMAHGGDLDVVAFVDDMRIMVECKSGNPDKITKTQMELFLRRAAEFHPSIALLLIDTEVAINKQVEMLRQVFLESTFVGPGSSRKWNVDCVHISNVAKSIDRSLRETLLSHNSGRHDDRPLVGLSLPLAQPRQKTAADHIKDLQMRVEIQRNRPSPEQTMTTWMERVGGSGYHYVQEVFSGESPVETFCRFAHHRRGDPFSRAACSRSALLAGAPDSQCAEDGGKSSHHQTVRDSRAVCGMDWPHSRLTRALPISSRGSLENHSGSLVQWREH